MNLEMSLPGVREAMLQVPIKGKVQCLAYVDRPIERLDDLVEGDQILGECLVGSHNGIPALFWRIRGGAFFYQAGYAE